MMLYAPTSSGPESELPGLGVQPQPAFAFSVAKVGMLHLAR